jgi:hypothetical protein
LGTGFLPLRGEGTRAEYFTMADENAAVAPGVLAVFWVCWAIKAAYIIQYEKSSIINII